MSLCEWNWFRIHAWQLNPTGARDQILVDHVATGDEMVYRIERRRRLENW